MGRNWKSLCIRGRNKSITTAQHKHDAAPQPNVACIHWLGVHAHCRAVLGATYHSPNSLISSLTRSLGCTGNGVGVGEGVTSSGDAESLHPRKLRNCINNSVCFLHSMRRGQARGKRRGRGNDVSTVS